MIQRIQTLFLAIVVAASICLFFFPLAGIYSPTSTYHFYIYEFRNMVPGDASVIGQGTVLPLAVLNALIGLISAVSIFYYRNRITQVKLVRVAIFLDVVLLALIFFVYAKIIEKYLAVTPDYMNEAGIYFPLVILIFLMLANRFILKDERLVRSINRLR